jgi:hypothetical protein
MAHVRSAILCDFAQVREGLLFVSSGGITRIAAPGQGAPVQFSVAGEIEVLPFEVGSTHDIVFKVSEVSASRTVWEATLSISTDASPEGLFPGESLHVPYALPVGPFPANTFGPHDLKVSIDNSETELLTFYVLQMVTGDSS